MIAQFRRRHAHARGWTALAVACMLALAGLGLTDAVRGEQSAAQPAAAASPSDDAAAAAASPVAATQPGATAVTTAATDVGRAGPVATAEALRKLGRPVEAVNFNQIPLSDAIDFLRETSGLNFFVNWRALESAGIQRDAHVSVSLKNISHEQALRYILRDAGGEGVALDFAVIDGIVNVSTADELARDVKVRVYDIQALLGQLTTGGSALDPAAVHQHPQLDARVEKIMQTITQTIAPDSWRDAGGSVGQIRELNGKLVISQTEANHAAIAKLLSEITTPDPTAASAPNAPAAAPASGY